MDVDTVRRICKREGLEVKSLLVRENTLITEKVKDASRWQELVLCLSSDSTNFESRSDFLILLSEMCIANFVPVNISADVGELRAEVTYRVK